MWRLYQLLFPVPAYEKYKAFSTTMMDTILRLPEPTEFEQRYKENGLLIAKWIWICFASSLVALLSYPYASSILIWGFKFKDHIHLATLVGQLLVSCFGMVMMFSPLAQGVIMLFPKKLSVKEAWAIALFVYILGYLWVILNIALWRESGNSTLAVTYLALLGIPLMLLGPVVSLYRHKGIGLNLLKLSIWTEWVIQRMVDEICKVHESEIPTWKRHVNTIMSWYIARLSNPRDSLLFWLSAASIGLTLFFALEDRAYVYKQIVWLNETIGYLFVQFSILTPYLAQALVNTDYALDKIYCRVLVRVMKTKIPKKPRT